MKHPDIHPGCNMITRTSQLKTSSVKGGTWVLACDQHVASSINEDFFKKGKLAQDDIAHPSMACLFHFSRKVGVRSLENPEN